MKQILLSEEEQTDLSQALEQIHTIYGGQAKQLEQSIETAHIRIKDLRKSQDTIVQLRTKVTLAENVVIDYEMSEDETFESKPKEMVNTHTICMCNICINKRQSIITDDSIEQME